MIRVLLIGDRSERWAEQLRGVDSEELEVRAEELPAAGVRAFGEASPDAVVIVESEGSGRAEPLLEALDEKPLAALVPILVVGGEDLEASVDVDGVVPRLRDGGPPGLLARLEERLDADFGEAEGSSSYSEVESSREIDVERSRPGVDETGLTMSSTEIPAPKSGDDVPSSRDESGGTEAEKGAEEPVERSDYVIEPLESPEEAGESDEQAGSTARGSRAQEPSSSSGRSDVGAEEIRRKLKQVRHEDYYTILEVPRTADGEAIQEAYRDLERRYNPRTLASETANRFEAELGEIKDALDDARAVLGDQRLREAYLEGTTRK